MATIEELLSDHIAALSPDKQDMARQILSELSDDERNELGGALSLLHQQESSPVQTGMPVMNQWENEAQQIALQQSQRQSPTNYLNADPQAVVWDRFMEQVVDPALKMGLMAAGGYYGGALVGSIPKIASMMEGGFMARQGANLATTIGANIGAQAPLLGYEMMADMAQPGDDPNVGKNFYQNVVPGLDLNTALNYGVPMAASAVLGEGGRYLADRANRSKNMAQAFSQNPADYIDAPGNMPVPQAVDRIAGLPEDVLNPSVLKAENPFAEIDSRLQSVQGLSGQRAGSMATEFPPVSSKRLNPTRVLATPPELATTGAQADTVSSVLKTEMPNFEDLALQRSGAEVIDAQGLSKARQAMEAADNVSSELGQKLKAASVPGVLSAEEYFDYKTAADIVNRIEKQASERRLQLNLGREIEDLAPETFETLEAARQQMDFLDAKIRSHTSNQIATGESLIKGAQFSGTDVMNLKQGYDKAANYEKQALNTPRQQVYGQLGDNSRRVLYDQANQAGKLEPFEREMRKVESAATLQPMAARRAAEMQARSSGAPAEVVGVRTDNNLIPRAFARTQEFFRGKQTPEDLLRRGMGQKWTQRLGGRMEGLSSPGNIATASNVMGGEKDYGITGQLGVNVDALKPLPTPPMNIPRSVPELMRSPDIVGQLIQEFSAPDQAIPRYYQWQRAVSSGDKTEIARFMADLSKMSPDFPLARGQITGLPSEFDIGDGFARLFSDDDKVKWESTIESSQLGEDEKALRIMALRKHSIAMPLSVKLNKPVIPPVRPRENPDSQFYQYADRSRDNFGSRKVEE